MLLDKLRVHYKFKFLIKVKSTPTGLEISKIAPIFTQMGLEEGSNLDDLVKEFFNVYCSPDTLTEHFTEFFILLELIIWRSTNMNNIIYIRPWTAGGLISVYLSIAQEVGFENFYFKPGKKFFIPIRRGYSKQARRYALSLFSATQFRWTPEWGYRLAVTKLTARVRTLRGTFLTYLKHFEMVGRKINFRRKVLKKKFEDYS